MEKNAKQSASTVGMLDAGGANLRHLPTTGSDLPPGLYKQVSPIQQLLQKSVSKRGPYDTFTGERYKPPKALVRKLGLYQPCSQAIPNNRNKAWFFIILAIIMSDRNWAVAVLVCL